MCRKGTISSRARYHRVGSAHREFAQVERASVSVQRHASAEQTETLLSMACAFSLMLALQLLLLLLMLMQVPAGQAGPVPGTAGGSTNRLLVHIDKGKYTLTRPLLPAKRRPANKLQPIVATPSAPVTGQLTESNAENANPKNPQPSIIVVPKWRESSGCRIYQRTDPRGRCRDRW